VTRRCSPARLAAVKRQMLAIENALNDLSNRSRNKVRAARLACAADKLTEVRACGLWKLK
jgi:hypothetical protein